MYKLDLEPLSPKLRKNREAHVDYLRLAKENAHTLHDIVEQARAQQPLDSALEYARKFTTRIQELLVYDITNKPLLTSTRVKSSTSASGSQPSGNTKKNKISRTTSSNQKNKVEDHLRSVKSSLNKRNHVSECNASTQQNVLKVNSKFVCKTCNEYLFTACHDLCVADYLNNVNERAKYRSAMSNKKKDWKPMGTVFTNVGYRWIHIGRTFTIDGNKFPLTRITSTTVVPPKKTIPTKVVKQTLSSNSFGEHAVHCKELPGFKYRHDLVRDVLYDVLKRAGISSRKEAPVNFLTDPLEGRSTLRLTDIFVFGWAGGKHACVDLTGVSPLVGLRDNGFVAGQAALKAESSKVAKHEKACLENQHVFIPFAFDTFGFLAPEAEEFLNRLSHLEYEWNPPRCGVHMVFAHDTVKYPKRVVDDSRKNEASTSGTKNFDAATTKVGTSNPIDVLRLVANEDDLGAIVGNVRKSSEKAVEDRENDIKDMYNETRTFMAPKQKKSGSVIQVLEGNVG
ncbi:hypothetical protein Tco_0813827 [Tanacetum coccineum]